MYVGVPRQPIDAKQLIFLANEVDSTDLSSFLRKTCNGLSSPHLPHFKKAFCNKVAAKNV